MLGTRGTLAWEIPRTEEPGGSPAAAKSLQSCLTLCDPIDGSPPDFPIPGILQARTLEWVAISFSNAWKWKVKVKSLSCVWLLATPWTAAHQAPPSMGFSKQEYWSGLPLGHKMSDTTERLTHIHISSRWAQPIAGLWKAQKHWGWNLRSHTWSNSWHLRRVPKPQGAFSDLMLR